MAHEPKMTVYIIRPKPYAKIEDKSNRNLFLHLVKQVNGKEIRDDELFLDVFKIFISALDQPEMFSDRNSNKCITANQPDISNEDIAPNINFNTDMFVIEGVVEGGSYGKKRTKTNTSDKSKKSEIAPVDAITDDFYFYLFLPPAHNKMVLMLQSYSDDSIDSVMRVFIENFFMMKGSYYKPELKVYTPNKIIEDFKQNVAVSSISYTTDVPGETLAQETKTAKDKHFAVTIKIQPLDGGMTIKEFNEAKKKFGTLNLGKLNVLGKFRKKSGTLMDKSTEATSVFELDSDFDIQPRIILSKYGISNGSNINIDRLREFCTELIEEIKTEIFKNGIQEY